MRELYQLGNNDAAMAYRYPLLVCIICRYCTTFVNIRSIRSPDAERSPTPIVICIDQQWVNYVGMYILVGVIPTYFVCTTSSHHTNIIKVKCMSVAAASSLLLTDVPDRASGAVPPSRHDPLMSRRLLISVT